jgi:hypothetical protein
MNCLIIAKHKWKQKSTRQSGVHRKQLPINQEEKAGHPEATEQKIGEGTTAENKGDKYVKN